MRYSEEELAEIGRDKAARLEQASGVRVMSAAESARMLLPPVQRRTQPAFAPADLSMLRSVGTLVGSLDPTGDEMDDTDFAGLDDTCYLHPIGATDPTGEESDWNNDTREATGPRVSFGKLRLLPPRATDPALLMGVPAADAG